MELYLHILVVLLVNVDYVYGQINSLPQSGQTQFYLDRYSDCDGKPREIYRSTVLIYGTSAEQQGQPVTSCTITLSAESGREPYRFKLQILQASIKKSGVYFYIYDGDYNGKLLYSFSSSRQKPSDLDFIFTTGQLVTFRMTKGDTTSQTYADIRVIATPVPSELLSTVTTQATKMTTINKEHVDTESNGNTVAGGGLVGIIAGILVGFCLVLGTVLFWAKRRNVSKSREIAVQSQLDSGINYENIMSRLSGRWNSDNNTRPPSQIYKNAVTENEILDNSLSNSIVHEAVLTNAVEINRVSVSYQKPSDTDDSDHQSGGNSDVYNTLFIYQNPTENIYSALNDS